MTRKTNTKFNHLLKKNENYFSSLHGMKNGYSMLMINVEYNGYPSMSQSIPITEPGLHSQNILLFIWRKMVSIVQSELLEPEQPLLRAFFRQLHLKCTVF